MKVVDKILQTLSDCITFNSYQAIETEIIELKPTPVNRNSEETKSLYESINAFLNTKGGIVIIGIEEKTNPKKYVLRSYNEDFENIIKDTLKNFKDKKGNNIDISNYINFEIKDFLNDRVLVLFVDKLPEENKFIFFKGFAYKRVITGDQKISEDDIQRQEELIEEIVNARELLPVKDASLNDVDIDKLNEYIQLLNKETKIETFKADINSALPFLVRKKFILDNKITTLGMLVCGKHPEDFIGGRCQVDGFVDSSILIAQDKRVYKDNILPLMEKSVVYIYKNIQVGVSFESGGKQSPEYPERLIRECVNNSLAHRDYSIDKYVNITIKPNAHIEIRNPGSFKKNLLIEETTHKLPIRRIIPDSKPKNPKLADILKVFDKWEGKGIGMATLVNYTLDNIIDLPFYKFYSETDLGLFIRKGRLFDENMTFLLETFDAFIEKAMQGEEMTMEQKLIFSYFFKSEIENKQYHYTILLHADNNHFKAIERLEKAGLLFKHEKSHNLYPVYFVNREFVKTNTDFYSYLRTIFGGGFDSLSNDYKAALVEILKSNSYSKRQAISARQTALNLYYAGFANVEAVKLDNFRRKIRIIINRLEQQQFIKKLNDKPQYIINTDYIRTISLFD